MRHFADETRKSSFHITEEEIVVESGILLHAEEANSLKKEILCRDQGHQFHFLTGFRKGNTKRKAHCHPSTSPIPDPISHGMN